MATTITNRAKRVLVELAEDENLTSAERLEAVQIFFGLVADTPQPEKPTKSKRNPLLGN